MLPTKIIVCDSCQKKIYEPDSITISTEQGYVVLENRDKKPYDFCWDCYSVLVEYTLGCHIEDFLKIKLMSNK